jgi:DNA-directed RNA polymerase specialized sigma24 family protein
MSLFPCVGKLLAGIATDDVRRISDTDLLGSFIATRDESSFAALVNRHGPVVRGICRRVLGHAQDAEDAAQAVFLVLARHANRVRNPKVLGSWLHGVAVRVSRKALAQRQRSLPLTDMEQMAARPDRTSVR